MIQGVDAPLRGVTVVDLTRLLPGPLASQLLVDAGARVIKVEQPGEGDHLRGIPPERDGVPAMFAQLNRGKESVALDLRDPRGAEVLRRLVASADVLMESFRPGVMERLGLGPDDLREVAPRLVYLRMSGFGQDGPLVERPAHDINYLALSGLQDLCRDRDGRPSLLAAQLADIGGGALPAALGLLLALRQRDVTGVGTVVDLALLDGLLGWLPMPLANVWGSGGTGRGIEGSPAYDLYETSDGEWISVGCVEPRFWRNLCEALGRPDLAERDGTRPDEELSSEIADIFRSGTRAHWEELLGEADVCFAPVLSVEEALQTPHVEARGMLRRLDVDGVEVPVVASPLGTPEQLGPIPALGEHGEAVLRELGYDAADIAKLRDEGVLG
jgi:crotonobetainyl-CoA:carnitine CoA-transferase CaiB-like acyl-CoA transferase